MKFIEEIVVEEFLPTIRSMLAEELRDRGLTQNEVADALGISQSAVSKYAHGDVERNKAFTEDDRVQELVDRVADGLSTGDMTPIQALVEIEVLVRRLENGDVLASLHEERMPGLAEYGSDFTVHDPDSELRTSERVRSSLRRALRTLENTSGFANLIPNVGSNLVACLPNADGIEDVAGVPGRIFDVKGRTTIPSDPEFGVSEHAASVLLAARKHGVDARAAINVSHEEWVIDDLEAQGQTAVEFDAEADRDAAIAQALNATPDATVLYQTGGYGIEPIVYVLGEDPDDVVGTVRELLR
ncbi:MAG: putative fused transcriptional regulator/phosphomethylpyrimidine kinase [Natrialbaceae archaeon]|jgi:predicted fused transcriptional regulator/phosphomethylpyrimidine kinase/predicted transcriptional regulator